MFVIKNNKHIKEISQKTRRKKTLERISQVIQLLELSDGEFKQPLLKASWDKLTKETDKIKTDKNPSAEKQQPMLRYKG